MCYSLSCQIKNGKDDMSPQFSFKNHNFHIVVVVYKQAVIEAEIHQAITNWNQLQPDLGQLGSKNTVMYF